MEGPSSDRRALALAPAAAVAVAENGEIVCSTGGQLNALEGADPDVVRALLAHVDGTRDADAVLASLPPDAQAAGRAALSALLDVGIVTPSLRAGHGAEAPRDPRVLLLGNHVLFQAIDRALEASGVSRRCRVAVSSFASVSAARARVLGPTPLLEAGAYNLRLAEATLAELTDAIAEFDVVICAVEGQPYQAILDVNRAALAAGKPCLVVTPELVGPLVRGGAGPCFECWFTTALAATDAARWLLAPHREREHDRDLGASGVDAVARFAVRRATADAAAASVVLFDGDVPRVEPLLSSARCTACSPDGDEPSASALASAEELARVWPISPEAEVATHPEAYRTVGIVGGGTAGYLTALALRRHRPELEVTLIESSAIPVIGVGEATTPELVRMLHSPRFLGKDISDFYRRVLPTWKLGIKFQFGPRDFTFPFQRGRLLESQLYDGHLQNQSLGAMLMAADRSPVIRDERGKVTSLTPLVRGAYHLENRRFVRYLAEEALADGVHHIDAKIAEVRRSPDGQNVEALMTDDGRRLEFNLYVDCSGFRSLLLEGALQSPFHDWSSTLFTNRAVAAAVPHDGTVKPYTLAETMNAGWCWNIPFEENDHRGYVFSSRFLSADHAEAEMRATNPGMGDAALIHFRSGRHEHFWKGNVLAIGNAYGFVEPLESTAIHMMVLTLELVTTHFPASRRDRAILDTLNRKVGQRWDAIRWFLGVHYRFNHRRETAFWRAANAEVDVSGAVERLALYRERAPLSYRTSLFYTLVPPEFFSDDHSFDTLLMGLDVPTRSLGGDLRPVEDGATWKRRRSTLLRTAEAALPQAEALAWLREHPEDQARLVSDPQSWLHRSVPA